MQNNPLNHEKSLSQYEQQVSFVRTVLNHNSNLLSIFNDEERSAFEKYFLPDWIDEGNFVRYYEKWEKEDPEIIRVGNGLLEKFVTENQLTGAEQLTFHQKSTRQ